MVLLQKRRGTHRGGDKLRFPLGGYCTALAACTMFFLLGMRLGRLGDMVDMDDPHQMRQLQSSTTAAAASSGSPPASSSSPLTVFQPSSHSLHPKWKLWTEMDADEQQKALDKVGEYLRKYGTAIMAKGERGKIKHGSCELQNIGGDISHRLCGPAPEGPCTFFSFGINDDPSWDIDLANQWKCRGFAGDPTVEHKSKLHPLVTFHNFGATTISDNEERLINKGGEEEWWDTSMPKLKAFLGLKRVEIVKLDCEGCEVAFARDIVREDPTFLYNVDQLSIETHVTKTWLNSREAVYYFGLHFALLEEAGFQMEFSNVFGCSKRHEIAGCMPELEHYGYPCHYRDWKGHPNVVMGVSCQDFLWKRYPEKAQQALRAS